MKKKVGQVTSDERDEIRHLFERKNGLEELVKVITVDRTDLYEKLVSDMGVTTTAFQQWWDDMAQKYHWEGSTDGHWEIDFDTCEIYLVE